MANDFLKIYKGVTYAPRSADPTSPTEGDVFYSDGTPRAKGLWQYKDGAWEELAGGAALTVREEDGTPNISDVTEFRFTNGTVTDNGSGSVSIDLSGTTDQLVKVSSNDTTSGYLNGKLVQGTGITLTENNDGANETLTISAAAGSDESVKVSANDTTAGYLNGKLVAGANVTLTENNDGSNETLTLSAGGGSVDIFYQEKFEITDAADYTSGNNATFDNGGALAGTLADETGSPLAGTESLKYTQAAGSLNDFFKSDAITLDSAQKGNWATFSVYTTYDGSDDDIRIIVWDDTNNVELNSPLNTIKSSTGVTKHEVKFYVPSSASTLAWGMHVKSLSSGAILVMDNVEIKLGAFNNSSTIDRQKLEYNQSHTTLLANTAGSPFRFDGTLFTESGLSILTYTDSDGRFTANRDCEVTFSASSQNGSTGAAFRYRVNGSFIYNAQQIGSSNFWMAGNVTLELSKGDYVDIQTNTGSLNSTVYLHVIAEADNTVSIESAANIGQMLRFHTSNGHGSTNNKIRRFNTQAESAGGGLFTYTDSSTDGASFTFNQRAMVNIAYSDIFSAASGFGISKNSSQLTTAIHLITDNDRLVLSQTNGASSVSECSWMGIVEPGDVIRPHTGGAGEGSATDQCSFTISAMPDSVNLLLGKAVAANAGPSSNNASHPSGGTGTIMDFTSAFDYFDTHGGFDLSANTYTVPYDGVYQISAQMAMSPSSGSNQLYIRKNGTTSAQDFLIGTDESDGDAAYTSVNGIRKLLKGDVLRVYTYQSSGSNATLFGRGWDTYFSIAKIGDI